jgi:SNF2 family DNA or RNA helicase
MIARELLDRGVAKRLAVICPAHLCEQWQSELREKFGIDALVVQPATIGRLLRPCHARTSVSTSTTRTSLSASTSSE